MPRSKLSIISELLGLNGINGKRNKSKKTTNKWLEKQAKTEEARNMVKDMESNPVIQAAIVREITGVPVDPKDYINIDPMKRVEEVITRQMLLEMSQDDELKEQVKLEMLQKGYRDNKINGREDYNEMGEFSRMMPGQMPDYGFNPYNPLSIFDQTRDV